VTELPRVLVVDDDEDIREIIEIALQAHGYRVDTAADGVDCLRRLRDDPELPAIILLDMMMPNMNGWEVRDQLVADPVLSRVPLVFLTGNVDVRDELHGAVGVLHKPVELSALLEVIGRVASSRRG
jgi:CheY-like chemotaxis protein